MTTTSRGTVGTASLNTLDKMRAVISKPYENEPFSTSLIPLLSNMRGKGKRVSVRNNVENQKTEFMVKEPFNGTLLVGSSAPGTTTSLVYVDADLLEEKGIIHYEGEDILVDTINRDTLTLTLIRNWQGSGGNSPRNIPANIPIPITANRIVAEGSGNGQMWSLYEDFDFNYTERKRLGTGFTWDGLHQGRYNQEGLVETRLENVRRALNEMRERTFITRSSAPVEIGKGGTGNPSSTEATHYTAGLPFYLKTNLASMMGLPNWDAINAFMQRCASQGGGDDFIWMCSPTVCAELSKFGWMNPREQGYGGKTFGRELKTFFGDGWTATVLPSLQMWKCGQKWAKAMYVLDMSQIDIIPRRELDILEENSAQNGTDGRQVEMIVQDCLIPGNEAASGIIFDMAA